MWERSKTTYDYARFFKEWNERDVESWVMRDRNHPSIIMFSIGNEIYDTHVDAHGREITVRLRDLVKQYDYRGNAGITIGSNYMPWENAQRCAEELKLAGYNYGEKYYEEHHKAHPYWVIYGSETSSMVQSRGIYHFPLRASILTEDDEQCSSLGNSRPAGGQSPWSDVSAKTGIWIFPGDSSCGPGLITSGSRHRIIRRIPTSDRWTRPDSRRMPIMSGSRYGPITGKHR